MLLVVGSNQLIKPIIERPYMHGNFNESKAGRRNAGRGRGFTLVEMLLVLVILSILAAIVLPNLAKRRGEGEVAAAKTEISSLAAALQMYEVDNGGYPPGGQGLQALLVRSRDVEKSWKGPYLNSNKIPLDPWNRPYVYEIPGKHNPAGFDLYSKGKDGGTNVIGNWIGE